MSHFVIGLLAVFLSLPAQAKLFSNAYVSFELPPNWDCRRDGTEWVCISQFANQKPKEAMIILTAKEVGPNDTLAGYTAHLKEPRTLPNKSGPPTQSKVFEVKQRLVNNQPWIDGLHLGSEVTDYYTRYMATTKDRIAILVTFSAHKLHYTKYSSDFIKAINSLRVTATKDLLNRGPKINIGATGSGPGSGGVIGPPVIGPMGDITADNPPPEASGDRGLLKKLLGLALILAAIGIFLFLQYRKKKKPKKM